MEYLQSSRLCLNLWPVGNIVPERCCVQFLLLERKVVYLDSVCSYNLNPVRGSHSCVYGANTKDTVGLYMPVTQNSHARVSENQLPKWPQQQLGGFWRHTFQNNTTLAENACYIKRGRWRPHNAFMWLISVRTTASSTDNFYGFSQSLQISVGIVMTFCHGFFVSKPFQFCRYRLSYRSMS